MEQFEALSTYCRVFAQLYVIPVIVYHKWKIGSYPYWERFLKKFIKQKAKGQQKKKNMTG